MSDQYTPTTGQVREAWVEFARFRLNVTTEFLHGCFGLSRSGHEAVFGRWLNAVKAEAWEQGKRAEETAWIHVLDGHPVEEGDMCDQCPTDNPYREQETP